MKGPVICGVDGSSVAAGAVQLARELAQRYELPLVYAHVLEGTGEKSVAPRSSSSATMAPARHCSEASRPTSPGVRPARLWSCRPPRPCIRSRLPHS